MLRIFPFFFWYDWKCAYHISWFIRRKSAYWSNHKDDSCTDATMVCIEIVFIWTCLHAGSSVGLFTLPISLWVWADALGFKKSNTVRCGCESPRNNFEFKLRRKDVYERIFILTRCLELVGLYVCTEITDYCKILTHRELKMRSMARP